VSRVYIGLGSNLGERLHNLAAALRHIDALPDTALLGVSDAYESEAWPSPADPPYANAVALVDTIVDPPELLLRLKDIECEMGRDPESPRNAPRIIDLDILLAGEDEWSRADLTVPHPCLAQRDFVITPLLELDPEVCWPDGSRVTREGVRVGKILGKLGPIPGFQDRASTSVARSHEAEEWVAVYRHPSAYTSPGAPPNFIMGGVAPDAQVPFAQMVLRQEGIPFMWDPFDPTEATDPYGFRRPFTIMVPASMAERAKQVLREATAAPFDPGDAGVSFE